MLTLTTSTCAENISEHCDTVCQHACASYLANMFSLNRYKNSNMPPKILRDDFCSNMNFVQRVTIYHRQQIQTARAV